MSKSQMISALNSYYNCEYFTDSDDEEFIKEQFYYIF